MAVLMKLNLVQYIKLICDSMVDSFAPSMTEVLTAVSIKMAVFWVVAAWAYRPDGGCSTDI
jgi:hypothetical protein